MRAVAYVRVSRVGGRSGDSFISPDVQEDAIRAMAQRLDFTVIETITELDASGGDASREGWNRALRMVEDGKARAILVYNLSRFSRSQRDALAAIDRIKAAGGRLHSAQEGSFDESSAGTLLRDTILRFAQFERDRAKEGFAVAQASAIDRGLYTASRIPVGYFRDPESRKLVPDEMAPVVKELFEMRAGGESWTSLARWLIENGGSSKTDRSAVKWIISNVTYLGYSRSGEMVNRKAHEPIISQLLFDTANGVKGRKPRHDGSLSSQTLVNGLVTCEGCGHRMSVTKFGDRAGYACRTVNCDARAGANAVDLDAEVISRVFAYINRIDPATYNRPGNEAENAADADQAGKALAAAEYDRDLLIKNRELRRMLSADEYNSELVSLTETVSEARIAYEMTQAKKSEAPAIEGFNDVWDEWADASRREWLSGFLGAIIVRSANKRRIPVTNRLAIHLAPGNTSLTDRWLLPGGAWSREPFGDPDRSSPHG